MCLGGAKGCRSRREWLEDCKIRKRLIEWNSNAPELPNSSRLREVLSKEHSNELGTLIKAARFRTGDQRETFEILMLRHFPENHIVWDTNVASEDILKTMGGSRNEAWRRSRDLFKGNKVKWAINKFKPYKSPGPDGILTALLQKGIKVLQPSIVLLCRTSYTLGYQPKAWRGVKMVYIPKAGTKDPEQPKSYKPISLTYFLLKTMEKLKDLHIRSKYLVKYPLHKMQFAYPAEKSTASSLHHLVTNIEEALRYKEVALSAFVDIQGAFDNTGFESIGSL
jgi:hypothetical protein